jgi:hypothetical protein
VLDNNISPRSFLAKAGAILGRLAGNHIRISYEYCGCSRPMSLSIIAHAG